MDHNVCAGTVHAWGQARLLCDIQAGALYSVADTSKALGQHSKRVATEDDKARSKQPVAPRPDLCCSTAMTTPCVC